jgi:hypothetical protein
MLTLEYIYTTLDKNKWSIFLLIVLNILLYSLRYMKGYALEGFQVSSTSLVSGQEFPKTPSTHCPIYKMNIDNNEDLLKTYKKNNATVSIKNLEEIMVVFKREYDALRCNDYFASIGQTPTPKPV